MVEVASTQMAQGTYCPSTTGLLLGIGTHFSKCHILISLRLSGERSVHNRIVPYLLSDLARFERQRAGLTVGKTLVGTDVR